MHNIGSAPFCLCPGAQLAVASDAGGQGGVSAMDDETEPDGLLTQPQTQADEDGEPDGGEGEPWACLIGVGPTSTIGVIKLYDPCVEFGNATKNQAAQIRIHDPRIRRVCGCMARMHFLPPFTRVPHLGAPATCTPAAPSSPRSCSMRRAPHPLQPRVPTQPSSIALSLLLPPSTDACCRCHGCHVLAAPRTAASFATATMCPCFSI